MLELKDVVQFCKIETNEINLHAAIAGPEEGPLVFLLHGFPEFWYGWRNQIAPLAKRGFRVVVPDLRGYNLSDKPKGAASYHVSKLAADVMGLADHFGQQTFSVVGHDWGAAVGWWLASQHGTRLRRFVAMNAPHLAVWLRAMRDDPVQRKKSGYVRLFQIRYLPELLIGLDRGKALSKGFRDTIRPDAFTDADLEQYRIAWSQPGALTAMLNYYRALELSPLPPVEECRVACSTLIIWGKRDAYAGVELADASLRMCTDGRIVYLEQSTHWVQHDEPERVTDLLAEFLA